MYYFEEKGREKVGQKNEQEFEDLMYKAYAKKMHPKFARNTPDLRLYPDIPEYEHGAVSVHMYEMYFDDRERKRRKRDINGRYIPMLGLIQERKKVEIEGGYEFQPVDPFYFGLKDLIITNEFMIAYTILRTSNPYKINARNELKPWIVYLHGVPSNRAQNLEMLEYLARFFNVITIDFLGMGDSSKPRLFGVPLKTLQTVKKKGFTTGREEGIKKFTEAWKWGNHVQYIKQVLRKMLPKGAEFVFACDDWGGGVGQHLAVEYNKRRKFNDPKFIGLALFDPVTLQGYPVPEIQIIGQASMIFDDKQFMMAMGAFGQTLVQILKDMIHNKERYNQFNMRKLMDPYLDSGYIETPTGEKSTSTTMGHKFHAIKVLTEMASMLGSDLLLPYTHDGVRFGDVKESVLIQWGKQDKMMPEIQRWRLVYAFQGIVTHYAVENAGHFVATDQPVVVAENFLKWMIMSFGKDVMEPFWGFHGIWQGDEKHFSEIMTEILLITQ